MADRKNEGMALLSVYADDDEEDADGDEAISAAVSPGPEPGTPAASQERFAASGAVSRDGRSEIVDYNHHESATSPKRNVGEKEALVADGPENSPQPVDGILEQSQPPGRSGGAEIDDAEDATEVGIVGVHPGGESQTLGFEVFDDFLPPPPQEKCSEALQTKFARYLALKNSGRSFNEELRNSKGYRNPDFLQRAVSHQEIDQLGTCFNKEVFDPHGYDPGDYYDAIYAEQKKQAARKQGHGIEFVRSTAVSVASAGAAGARPNAFAELVARQKSLLAASLGGQGSILGRRGFASVAPSVGRGPNANGEAASRREGRNKKSKWDKVDHDGKTTATASATTAKDAPDGQGTSRRG